jgi:hypothetical protein
MSQQTEVLKVVIVAWGVVVFERANYDDALVVIRLVEVGGNRDGLEVDAVTALLHQVNYLRTGLGSLILRLEGGSRGDGQIAHSLLLSPLRLASHSVS